MDGQMASATNVYYLYYLTALLISFNPSTKLSSDQLFLEERRYTADQLFLEERRYTADQLLPGIHYCTEQRKLGF